MKLYNTLTKKIEAIVPIHERHLGLYACGVTVYDYAHLGHLRKYVMDDVLVRALRQEGFEVKFVQNVTDVGHLASDADTGEDKLEKGAKKYGQTVWDVAQKFETYFFYSMDLMGNIRPDLSCRATDHIQSQLELVLKLEKKGFTYVTPGDGVYFDISKFPDYGQMAGLDVDNQLSGSRVAVVAGKRQPADFAVWKFEKPGENRAMVWPSPWAERSFPGWHIECSAMSMEHLGAQFEIHTGGIDHIPVHHTNEIAQAEAASGKKPFVKYWVHHNFLQVNGEKMSKSLGNFYTIDDILKRGFVPQALRLLFLGSHYRSQLNFTWESLQAAQTAWERLSQQVKMIHQAVTERRDRLQPAAEAVETLPEYRNFFKAIQTDLDTPQAMNLVWAVLKSAILSPQEQYRLLLEFDQVLGLGLAKLELSPAQLARSGRVDLKALPPQQSQTLQQLLSDRVVARRHQDWAKSDALRDQVNQLGMQLVDQTDGSQELRWLSQTPESQT